MLTSCGARRPQGDTTLPWQLHQAAKTCAGNTPAIRVCTSGSNPYSQPPDRTSDCTWPDKEQSLGESACPATSAQAASLKCAGSCDILCGRTVATACAAARRLPPQRPSWAKPPNWFPLPRERRPRRGNAPTYTHPGLTFHSCPLQRLALRGLLC